MTYITCIIGHSDPKCLTLKVDLVDDKKAKKCIHSMHRNKLSKHGAGSICRGIVYGGGGGGGFS